jgi:intein/homing endonuclease|tara:strand:+ start:171 stop:3548 length:3378 start_codon:yes stop_codon:yes gene_type:complete
MTKTIKIPYHPRNWSKAFHQSDKRWKVVVMHRRGGKTTACINQLIKDAMTTNFSRFAYVAPCYDDQTEILTDDGWMYFRDLKDEKVATLVDNKMVFEKPLEKYDYPFNEEMIGVKSPFVDMLVTPHHRCLVKSKNKKDWEIMKAEDVFGTGKFQFKKESEWVGDDSGDIDFFEFLGFWFADGSARVRTHQPKNRREKIKKKFGKKWAEWGEVVLTQKKLIDYVEDLILRNCYEVKKSLKKDSGGFNYYIYDTKLAKELFCYGKAKTKSVPDYVKQASPRLINAFLLGYWKGDGHFANSSYDTNRAVTASKKLADDIQELILKVGESANVSNYNGFWHITRLNKKYNHPVIHTKHWYKTNYNGRVYCVKVPSGIVMVRRNGKQYWCGNTYKQAKMVAWDMVKHYSRPIPGVKFNESELRADYPNGSRISLYGAENADGLRGLALWGVIFDEYSQQPSTIFTEVVSKCLADHLGYAVWIGCVHGDTKVLTKKGFQQIKEFDKNSKPKEYQNLNLEIYGIDKSWNTADGFWNNGVVKTKKIISKAGFEIECSEIHPLLTKSGKWVKSSELKVGDELAIDHSMEVWGGIDPLDGFKEKYSRHANSRKHDVFVPPRMDNDFAYLLGLWMAEGSVEKEIHRLSITCGDDVGPSIEKYGFHKSREDQWRLNNFNLIRAFKACGMPLVTAPNKFIPNEIFSISREHMRHFLGAFWDGDGHSKRLVREAGFTSSSKRLIQDIQLICSVFGAIGKIYKHITPPTKKVQKECVGYQLMFTGSDYERLMDFIKPRIKRKLKKLEETEFVRKRDFYKDRDGYFYDKIVSIEEGEAHTYDFTIPVTNSFWSNGFISHNTPKGKNDFYDIFKNSRGNTEWFSHFQDIDETLKTEDGETVENLKVALGDDKRMVKQGIITEDEFQQEWYCSFTAAIKGAYYGSQMSVAAEEGRIGNVKYDPGLKVHTFWDLGMADATAIWFVQFFGKEIRLIDYYEASGESLSHYVKVLQDKGYIYGNHTCPHDVEVRELATGRSRREVLESLGVYPRVAAKMPVMDGIDAVRRILGRCWFDEEKCDKGIEALRQYHKAYDDVRKQFSSRPFHDWSSHGSDAFRTFAMTFRDTQDVLFVEEERIEDRYSIL